MAPLGCVLRLAFAPRFFSASALAITGFVVLVRFASTPTPIGKIIDAQMARESSPEFLLQRQVDPTVFTADELQTLQRRFGVHGPQTRLAQLFTEGVDQVDLIRSMTLTRLTELKPTILREAEARHLNPMLLTGILYDEIQHSKPGESLPFVAHSGLVSTHGPAQLGISELIHQGLLPDKPTHHQITEARVRLLDPEQNIALLAAKLHRLKAELSLPATRALSASSSFKDAKAIAILAYLHNGKLDYPSRILRYMQDPMLHALIYTSLDEDSSSAI